MNKYDSLNVRKELEQTIGEDLTKALDGRKNKMMERK